MRTARLMILGLVLAVPPAAAQLPQGARFDVVVSPALRREAVTGRVFVVLARDSAPEPRLQAGGVISVPFFGKDVEALRPGTPVVMDRSALGYPLRSLDQLPPGDYYVQALLSPYTKFVRADGHTIWAHMDEWEGQQFNRAPGTLVSAVRRQHIRQDFLGQRRAAVRAGHQPRGAVRAGEGVQHPDGGAHQVAVRVGFGDVRDTAALPRRADAVPRGRGAGR